MLASKRQRQSQTKTPFVHKRQWGTERSTEPLPNLHKTPSTKKLALSRIAIIVTVAMWLLYVIDTTIRQFFLSRQSFGFTLEAVCYLLIITMLTFSSIMYLISRQGALLRFSKHTRIAKAVLDRFFAVNQPSITVLVPSYAEETDVIRKTLLSAYLQEYPKLRIVLLLDDPPYPSNPVIKRRLDDSRALASQIEEMFDGPRARFETLLKRFEKTSKGADWRKALKKATNKLSEEYIWAADWLNNYADNEAVNDHVDAFFVDQVIRGLAKELALTGKALAAAIDSKEPVSKDRLRQLHLRLVWIFRGEIEVFERKKYVSLSHEANKAMNLNSYIGLMGKTFSITQTPQGPALFPRSKTAKTKKSDIFSVPDTDFILTLDADSILLKEYCLRLVYLLMQPANSRIAVTQTPYSSFRGAPTRIERLAGATTDLQHILHQGLSHYGATFWVGANAVIRKRALEDIVQREWVGGFEISRYIQDRTVIEDTESSIDLALHGWGLLNYPERLSYSATPPDFGSLIVQRRRWANGGLLILTKLWTVHKERKRKNEVTSRIEILLRLNYMASITWASFGLIFLLAFPYYGQLLSPFVIAAALPYFIAMSSDLKYCGYKRSDVLRIYGLNLMLLPVNIAGVLKSIQQALTGKKIPFARTPKVKDRTIASLFYVIAPLLIVAFSLFTLWRNIVVLNITDAAFAAFNAATTSWAIMANVGFKNMLVDIWRGLTDWMYVEVKIRPCTAINSSKEPPIDWRSVLYHGSENGTLPLGSLKAKHKGSS